MSIPGWVNGAVFYQIFPDRFANGDPSNDPINAQPWGDPPTVKGYQGGDLAGIYHKLDFLLDLGINALYLNPIFLSAANHRYHTVDYYRIDPILGSMADFRALVEAAHSRNIRIILDGVFNHCGRGFFAFSDLLENGADSPYINWFHVHRFPLRAYDPVHERNYEAWWGLKGLPKFNTDTPAVRRYLLDVAKYWIDQGIDGWRLDVPNEINDDHFWAMFRQTVREANPDAYLVGEIWDVQPRWANDTHFDGLMNYPLRTALLDYLNGEIHTPQFDQRVSSLLGVYPRENVYAMYNLLGSHDTERVLTQYGGDWRKVALAYLFLFAYPGVPSVYYGDEIGLEGGKDPQSRGAFPWNEEAWNKDLRNAVRRLIAIRKGTPALTHGDYRALFSAENPDRYAFVRSFENEHVIVAMNAGAERALLEIPVTELGMTDGQVLHDMLGPLRATVQDGIARLSLEPYSGAYLR